MTVFLVARTIMSSWIWTCLWVNILCVRQPTSLACQKEEFSAKVVEKRLFEVERSIWSLACSGDGNLLAVAITDDKIRTIELWDTNSGKKKWSIAPRVTLSTRLSISPDGKILIASTGDFLKNEKTEVQAFAVETGKELFSFPVDLPGAVAFHPNGQVFAVCYRFDPLSREDTIQFRNAKDGGILRQFKAAERGYAMAFSGDGNSSLC